MVAFVDEHLAQWPVVAMCAAIELSERTYYAARARPASPRSEWCPHQRDQRGGDPGITSTARSVARTVLILL
jgi:hypothetical protein